MGALEPRVNPRDQNRRHKMKTTPHAQCYVGDVRYEASADGVIDDVDQDHIAALLNSGCELVS